MNKALLNKILKYTGIIIFFLALSYVFVYPVLEGKVVNQSDISGYIGMSRESSLYNAAHPEDPTAWTGSMFSGMPTTSFALETKGDLTQRIYDFLLLGSRPATYLFISLLGAFLLMLSFGIEGVLAIGGAIAITFCSYNMQIITVGHNTKMQALAFLPWVLASIIYTYKSIEKPNLWKTILGAALFGLTLSLQIKANHQQITYYLAIMIFIYAIAVFIDILKSKRTLLKSFFIASALLLFTGSLGILSNANKLLPLYKYTEHTMRGGSELSESKDGEEINAKGLSIDYATAWSYGIEELPNMMIPNYNGGSSAGAINPDKSETCKILKQSGHNDIKQISKSLPLYWGPQPFTAGPMYMGAITIFLFILGLFLYKGKEKWWLLVTTIIAILLALGNHFMWFTRLWFDYVPMYNKFRTVSMALVLLQFTLPLLGFKILNEILNNPEHKKQSAYSLISAYALTAGFCIICLLLPGIAGSFEGAADRSFPEVLVEALKADRRQLLINDALGSFIFITLAAGLIWWHQTSPTQQKKRIVAAGISILVFINMFSVGKRYLNSDNFVAKRTFTSKFTTRPVDKMILEDKDLSYRVLDLTTDIFNDSRPSYLHKNIGGYSPAKLQRYQDLISHYLKGEIDVLYKQLSKVKTVSEFQADLPYLPVLSMLNLRYIILGEAYPPVQNKYAYGNAWFVDKLIAVDTPDQEITTLKQIDLRNEAVARIGKTENYTSTPGDTIALTFYSPKELRYHYKSATARPAIFSEIYYKDGWKATLDNAEHTQIDLFNANWTLRGAILPAGEYDLIMRFEPTSYNIGRALSVAGSTLLLLLLLISAIRARTKKAEK